MSAGTYWCPRCGEVKWSGVGFKCPTCAAPLITPDVLYQHKLSIQAERAAEALCLGNILARIHGDGGHYQDKHGFRKATKDANAIVCEYWRSLDAAQFNLTEALDLLEAHQWDGFDTENENSICPSCEALRYNFETAEEVIEVHLSTCRLALLLRKMARQTRMQGDK